MTLGAFLTEFAFVRIVFLVAGDALARCFAKLLLWLMAAFTRERFMRAFQVEIGEFVAKRFLVELYDISVSAFMISMAMLAFGVNRIGT